MQSVNRFFLVAFALPLFLAGEKLFAFSGDSLLPSPQFKSSQVHVARNYIRPCVYFNYFATGSRPVVGLIDPFHAKIIDEKLGKYKFSQSNFGLYVPLYTHTDRKSTRLNYSHGYISNAVF